MSKKKFLSINAGLAVLDDMNNFAKYTNWVLTDMPMYAFRIRKPVPPRLATLSGKQWDTGAIDKNDIIFSLYKYHPEQVLLGRLNMEWLIPELSQDYSLEASHGEFQLFIRNDILKK